MTRGLKNLELPLPVLFVPLGSWDLKAMVANGEQEAVLKYINQFRHQQFEKMPKGNKSMVMVVDMEHYSLKKLNSVAAVETIVEIMRQFDFNYPKTLRYGIFLNSSRVFPMLFPLMKDVMGKQVTAARLKPSRAGNLKQSAEMSNN